MSNQNIGHNPPQPMTPMDRVRPHVRGLRPACWVGNVDEVRRVLDQTTDDIDGIGDGRMTPVMDAAVYGHSDIVALLVEKRADLLLRDLDGKNVLHYACRGGDVRTVQFLLSQDGVQVNSEDVGNTTPVMDAARYGHRDIVELLAKKGADLSLRDSDGNNVLHHACQEGHARTVRFLLSQNGVHVNGEGGGNRTPVMDAAKQGHRYIVGLLACNYADLSLRDSGGNNVLHLACQGGHAWTVRLILEMRLVDVNARNNVEQTAADVARNGGHRQLVDLLVSHGAR
ncbi:CARD- and ANK-domain containing inflammasome adapter protein-like [Haliotis rubra]|uniref:CARD- and ANK-domain containing inflammasome adapter protein-like n=1 Tax=Haliotis rubra TaxID=36100 RepID=UPI001EE58B6C|nr:CARD- and ANK-domain containing inflammasome adapter protein-like [Haliotis rubra]